MKLRSEEITSQIRRTTEVVATAEDSVARDCHEDLPRVDRAASLGALKRVTPFSPISLSLLRLFDKETVGAGEIANLVNADAVLTAELLTWVNSALFGLREHIIDVKHAVAVLGMERTRSLALTLATRSLLNEAPKTSVVRRVWRHSLATAIVAEQIAPVYRVLPDLAYTLGLLHDLGRCALLAAYPKVYTEIAALSHKNREAIVESEQAVFGMDHCQAGKLLSEEWRLPDIIQRVVNHHLDQPDSTDVLAAVQVSCRIAVALNFAAVPCEDNPSLDETLDVCVPPECHSLIRSQLQNIEEGIKARIEPLDF
jgi:HD-like signal output (HDOD) protein